jgi:hypothetical protein
VCHHLPGSEGVKLAPVETSHYLSLWLSQDKPTFSVFRAFWLAFQLLMIPTLDTPPAIPMEALVMTWKESTKF